MLNTISVTAATQNCHEANGCIEGVKSHSRTVVPLNKVSSVERASETLFRAFAKSTANDYLLKKFSRIPLNENVSRTRFNAMIYYYTSWFHDLGGEVVEANDYDAVGIWSLPGRHLPATLSEDPKFNKTFFEDLDKRKYEVIPPGMGYYYLFMVGKDPSQPKVRGSVKTMLNHYKERADKDNCAIVLEAISEHARSVYEYFGFKVYLTFKYGESEVNTQGVLDLNGEGFTGYLMLYHKDAQNVFRNC
ncbi:hypothetical protein HG535_0E03100 [Zygotorulaspora mrakii]|uniref:N-acetyltransferase domain-containing protein n=1 Tax=Zygotorulaspora mrakii TaxID=42260 RepID=A0A7H9B4C7_ZYGMR|nr:uncharacterized protein HG535_0E03100 [Zygotorulaspora mrakii]QLG73226.1 hypothetical protein HG535_0E03100 [Zygotorulaspora mrakii]